MPTVSISYAVNEIQDNGLNFWTVKDKNALLAEQDENISAEDSAELLRSKLEAIGNGTVNVTASGKPRKDRKGAETFRTRQFIINLDRERPVGAAAVTSYHTPQYEKLQHEILDLERKNLQLKYALEHAEDRIADLEKEIKELENSEGEEEEETIAGLKFSDLGKLLMGYLTAPQPGATQPPINGLPDSSAELQKFYSREKQAAEIIAAINRVMDKDPGTYGFIKNTLLSNYGQ
jgi:hypothetical protein